MYGRQTEYPNKAQIIKESVTAKDYLNAIGYKVDSRGFCRCPVHRDKTASVKVYSDPKKGWYCFGCHEGGDVIRLAMLTEHCDFVTAVHSLAERFHIDIDSRPKNSKIERKPIRCDILAEQLHQFCVETDFLALEDAVRALEYIKRMTAPQRPFDVCTEQYRQCCVLLEEFRELRDEACWERMKYEERR